MPEFRTITDGLHFPEGPIAMPDGSIVLVEIEAGNLTRVQPDGSKEVIAHRRRTERRGDRSGWRLLRL